MINKKVVIIKMQMKVHFTNDLKINMLFDINILISHKFMLNYAS